MLGKADTPTVAALAGTIHSRCSPLKRLSERCLGKEDAPGPIVCLNAPDRVARSTRLAVVGSAADPQAIAAAVRVPKEGAAMWGIATAGFTCYVLIASSHR